jgi:hypothetical protein
LTILVAFLSRVDYLRGRGTLCPRQPPSSTPTSACASPWATPSSPSSCTALDPEKLQEALLQVFPGADLGEVLVVDGKHLKGSGKGKSPQVRLVEVLALHLLTTLAQAKAEGREDQALLELLDRLGAEGLKGKVGGGGRRVPVPGS